MFVYVEFQIAPAGTRFRVPATAIVARAQGTQVVTIAEGNKLHFQDVVLGRDFAHPGARPDHDASAIRIMR